MKTILQLITFPAKQAVHGGQRRAHALKGAYRKAGYRVITCSIFNPLYYAASEKGQFDIEPSQQTLEKVKDSPLLEDIILGESCSVDPQVRNHIVKLLDRYQPDFIAFEHPYMFLGVKDILKSGQYSDIGIINSTHNIEYEMKKDIYRSRSDMIDDKTAKRAVEKVRRCEERLAKVAQLTIVVSEKDAEENRKHGASTILLVPNGISQYKLESKTLNKWKQRFEDEGIEYPILFTGSAHGPNALGFETMIGFRPGFMPMNSKIYIVGGVGNVIQDRIVQADPFYGRLLWERAVLCGQLSDRDLSALISLSKVIILPITEGGGSNLKTAEAIISGKNIIATTHAMRGYEEFKGSSRIAITDNPSKFKSMLTQSLKAAPRITNEEKERAQAVLWSQRTKPLQEYMEKI